MFSNLPTEFRPSFSVIRVIRGLVTDSVFELAFVLRAVKVASDGGRSVVYTQRTVLGVERRHILRILTAPRLRIALRKFG